MWVTHASLEVERKGGQLRDGRAGQAGRQLEENDILPVSISGQHEGGPPTQDDDEDRAGKDVEPPEVPSDEPHEAPAGSQARVHLRHSFHRTLEGEHLHACKVWTGSVPPQPSP
jgi:hypothetical protein